ncbi:hypothetical protein NGB36_03630 [Streptomyces sp. RB6PN25]|uniref:Uncharacterized protein n=1 Tax=Streptomyces humicola TaxID=2953240 RepID=A0ABT1PPV3_9ACTN|nr:hypothetical protein [Streptomyces humicola]MCQ4079707.1 hypothetical protein [Streptomyces humicola]
MTIRQLSIEAEVKDQAEAAGRPLADLIAGRVRDTVPITSALTPGLVGDPAGAHRVLVDAATRVGPTQKSAAG